MTRHSNRAGRTSPNRDISRSVRTNNSTESSPARENRSISNAPSFSAGPPSSAQVNRGDRGYRLSGKKRPSASTFDTRFFGLRSSEERTGTHLVSPAALKPVAVHARNTPSPNRSRLSAVMLASHASAVKNESEEEEEDEREMVMNGHGPNSVALSDAHESTTPTSAMERHIGKRYRDDDDESSQGGPDTQSIATSEEVITDSGVGGSRNGNYREEGLYSVPSNSLITYDTERESLSGLTGASTITTGIGTHSFIYEENPVYKRRRAEYNLETTPNHRCAGYCNGACRGNRRKGKYIDLDKPFTERQFEECYNVGVKDFWTADVKRFHALVNKHHD